MKGNHLRERRDGKQTGMQGPSSRQKHRFSRKGIGYMTEKELKKLSRAELLEMLIAQSKKLSRTEEELQAAKEKLEQRSIAITDSGTMAEAALKLNGIFEAADEAARQYLENVRQQESEAANIVAEAQRKANGIIKSAEARRVTILAEADKEVRRRIDSFSEQFREFINTHT